MRYNVDHYDHVDGHPYQGKRTRFTDVGVNWRVLWTAFAQCGRRGVLWGRLVNYRISRVGRMFYEIVTCEATRSRRKAEEVQE